MISEVAKDLQLLVFAHYKIVLIGTIILLLSTRLIYNKYGHGVNHIPGPTLASFTDLWRLLITWSWRPENEHIRLHRKHGKLVRLGPKTISVSDPRAIQTIYALNSGYIKSSFYSVQQTVAKGRRLLTLFTSQDEKFHAKLRRAVNNAYAMSTLVQFEPLVDSTTTAFLDQIQNRFADRYDSVCDFDIWLQYYAFDVIGELTYSKRLGFVDNGVDVDGIIGNLEKLLNYAAVVGQIPFLDELLLKNPLRILASRWGLISSDTPVVVFARQRISGRVDPETFKEKPQDWSGSSSIRRDFLSRFLEAHDREPTFITKDRVLALTVANMFAGSDTTAISLRAIFYNLLKNPEDLKRLLDELQEQQRNGKFKRTDGIVEWEAVRELPFLSAVIKEGLRIHPAAGLPLERIVPPGGVTICDTFIPGGSIVGCSAWTVHLDESIFGSKPEQFRPQRWLDASPAQRREMENFLFTFGAGSRTCIGKNISYLEMYKLVPAVLMRFEVELAAPDEEWKLHNAWFVKQSNFRVRFRTRR
ncbi:uncharacterized protein Z518_00737 [Rhinocladiella mackenziei CBS 650.93]|uniref:Uncharacterized protein n=1 Tax=Rhinocladiella mackenziei CBS 650.93 TaxID=1442369 RepID=A0A0D2J1T8_9EURO|nr:uncharacterized protein Z518_00737 [Rhinocladiella mackenziei CBS 650.93]KIX09656.1 hypothetical protein Z518_00737 [Rhinocladiella mackenziei CBS 650.93]